MPNKFNPGEWITTGEAAELTGYLSGGYGKRYEV